MLIFLPLSLPQNDAITQNAEWNKAHPSFEVTATCVSRGLPNCEQTIIVESRKWLLFRAKMSVLDYSVSDTPAGYVEIEKSRRMYDEQPYPGRAIVVGSRLSAVTQETFPSFILATDLRELIPKSAAFTFSTKDGLNVASTTFSMQQNQVTLILSFEASGMLHHATVDEKGPNGTSHRDWAFSPFKEIKHPTMTRVLTPIPLGYVPYALADDPYAAPVGTQVALAGWRSPGGKQSVDFGRLAKGKPFLIAVIGSESPPSLRAEASVRVLKKSLPVFEISSTSGKASSRLYTDLDGSRLSKLSVPGTPCFYLIGSDGKVKDVWLGYDPAKQGQFESDVIKQARLAATSSKP